MHPATLVTAPGAPLPEIALILNRKRSALARHVLSVKKRGREEEWAPHLLKLKGPYGGIAPLSASNPTILWLGGSGVTPGLALLDEDQRLSRGLDLAKNQRMLHVYWALRGTDTGCSLLKAAKAHLGKVEGPELVGKILLVC